MKGITKLKGIGIAATMLLAALLIAAISVPTVWADDPTDTSQQRIPDKVDQNTSDMRTPTFIRDLMQKGFTESEIAKATLNMTIKRQEGWTDEDNERVVGYFKQVQKELLEESGSKDGVVQKDGRMTIDEENYHGINGYMRPGDLQVSSDGTQYHYFTNHIGNSGIWIEVGVARFHWEPDEYVVYTYDSTRPAGQEWETWGTTDPNVDHHFIMYVYDYDGTGYPYNIWWDDNLIRSGKLSHYNNNPDENHECFAASVDDFESCSVGYFKDSFLYKKEGNNYNAYWWNGDLPETTHSYGLSPVKVNRYIPGGSSSYKIDSWID